MRIRDWSSDVCSSDLPHRSPRDPVARLVEAREGASQPLRIGQDRVFGNGAIGECDHPRGRGAKAHLAVDLRGVDTGRPALDDEAADFAVELGPDDREYGDRGVRDPRLAAVAAAPHLDAFGAPSPRAVNATPAGPGAAAPTPTPT